jgi:hypothetical protein
VGLRAAPATGRPQPTTPPVVPAAAKSYVCDACDTITFNQPEDGDVLCDLCSPDAYHAAEAAEAAAIDDAEQALLQRERDAERDAQNKCDDCCQVAGCPTCGPCPEHDGSPRVPTDAWEAHEMEPIVLVIDECRDFFDSHVTVIAVNDGPARTIAAGRPGSGVSREYVDQGVAGPKYVPGMTPSQLAKNVRADIKAAIAAGDLPGKADGFKYHVRTGYGAAVDVNVEGPGDDAWAYRPATDEDLPVQFVGAGQTYTDEAKRIGILLHRMAGDYVYRNTDTRVVSCYTSARAGSDGPTLPVYDWQNPA